jgi:hypothetical protein
MIAATAFGPMSLYRQARQLALMETAVEMSEAEHLIDSPQHIAQFFFRAYEKHLTPTARVRSERQRLDETAVQQVAMKLAMQLATVLRMRNQQFEAPTYAEDEQHLLDYVRLYPMHPGLDRTHLSDAYHALQHALRCENEQTSSGSTEDCASAA